MFKIFKLGQNYLNTWPKVNRLGGIFPENRIIQATVFSQKFMPFIAVFSVFWQQIYLPSSLSALAIAVMTAIFALFLPLQGLYWLGKRSKTKLPAKSAVSFYKISKKLQEKNIVVMTVDEPTYQDLANLLNKAEKHFSKEFWDDI
ncbi:hypothetical protein EV697_102135 [Bisgaardia hudsonensis]|uniref:UPF0208 membrane protein YfbV n=1 Tax=Bisgaardia hudsonensis TaxID=109472 RepID=A0A4V2SJ61_9PAST|nr:terminus macrodomain insulation protein YfbV [Bisgaardia hudsonensis]QLB13165.1 hypothetical protein A6A11_05830 [Bisgaardia hudsonensis]TCP13261.1 hypothetical protein EV697_102135 [Bisgaardia hudsonensis]